jgi:phytanoyl-CoA hydroxylase
MLNTTTPTGAVLNIPETLEEDTVYFRPDDFAGACEFYGTQGYVVLRDLIPADLCARARASFDASVRASPIPILRQKNMRYERNALDADGFLSNPIFNVQDLGSRSLGGFRDAVLDILTHRATAAATAALLSTERTKLIQSMFFEAPAGTWAHQDRYYQDSAAELGGCVAGWFALEDIDAGAGRFYVCPGSHQAIPLLRNAGAHNFATGHQAYQQAMLEAIRSNGFACAAPFLAAGDVLFWNSLTVHGSLPSSRPGVSRSSLTAHYLREGDAGLQFHSRIRGQAMRLHGGMKVGLLHDQDALMNRVVREAAFHFPKSYATARRIALRALIIRRSLQQALHVDRQETPAAVLEGGLAAEAAPP